MEKRSRFVVKFFFIFITMIVFCSSCLAPASDWTRRDMPTDGLKYLVTYNLNGKAGTSKEVNQALLRGVNENAPLVLQKVVFDRMSGSKTQDVYETLSDGKTMVSLGMVKTQRFAGLTRYMSLEIATFAGEDITGKVFGGAKIRLQFNRNFVQYADANKRDWDSLWYYDVPASKDGADYKLDLEKAKLRCVVLNQVWQARIASGSFFFNWGHSVTSIGGLPATLPGAWWLNWDEPNTEADTIGAAKIVNAMVLDLESSPSPWVEYKPDGLFKNSYLIYSAGDADQYATWNRIFLDRQNQYAVLYRPNRETAWDFITVKPVYNYEWNDVAQELAGIRGWNKSDPMQGKLDPSGMPKDTYASAVKELERIGWMNAPNASLEQIQLLDSGGNILYAMTVRAFIGASDTLVMFGKVKPELKSVKEAMPSPENLPMPVLYDGKGNPLSQDKQPYNDEQWARWQRESTMWNFIKDNPNAVGSELQIQYRFADNTSWAPITCHDSNGNAYTCGHTPVEWDLSTSYYFDSSTAKNSWLAMQFLGEVGVRTLGMSYASGLYEGTGMLFAMSQMVHREEFLKGFSQESLWVFDARASQLPDRLAAGWKVLRSK